MTRTIEDLGPHVARRYPFRSQFANVNGWRMHYIDEGSRDAPPVLLLHGNPTWGYLWRDTIPPLLAAGYRVIVPDQIGFGLSEHPHAASAHSLDNHAANLVALIDRLDLTGVFFVCHDWGGPTGLSALLTRAERAVAVAVMSTWAWREPAAEFHCRIMPWRTLHAPLVGPFLSGRQGAFPRRPCEQVGEHLELREDANQSAAFAHWRSHPLMRAACLTPNRKPQARSNRFRCGSLALRSPQVAAGMICRLDFLRMS